VRIRTSGGTVPIAPFIDALGFPAISVPIVNFDNNQHGENENLRLGHFFRALRSSRGHCRCRARDSGFGIEVLQEEASVYELTLNVHSLLRWLVVLVGLVAAVRSLGALVSRRPWTPLDDNAGRWFAMSVDVQTLIGLALYGLLSPITRTAFANMGEACGTPPCATGPSST